MAQDPDITSSASELSVADLVFRLQQAATKPEASVYGEELIRRFHPLIYKAWRHSGLETEFSDFVQDVFLRIFRNLAKLHNPKAFPGYFRRVIMSVAAEQARRQLKMPSISSIEEEEVLNHLVTNIDEAILTGIFVRTYLEQLSETEKEVLTLEFVGGNSTELIAEKLGLSPAAVRTVKSRAFKKLRKLMLKDAEHLEKSSR